ncbi:hypothetical protein ACF3DV_25850 [Chlorogloeopsis fritschii PCC 9212]|nr:hypothetical protein [Chlorogloeopsis fritschii]
MHTQVMSSLFVHLRRFSLTELKESNQKFTRLTTTFWVNVGDEQDESTDIKDNFHNWNDIVAARENPLSKRAEKEYDCG